MPKEIQNKKKRAKPLLLPIPNVKQVRSEIEAVIKMFVDSYREVDGALRDEGAIWTVGCLKRALELLPMKGGR